MEVSAVAGRSLADWYALGGPLMHALVACSVFATAIVIERLWVLRRAAVVPRALVARLREAWDPADPARTLASCRSHPSTLGRLARVAIAARSRGEERPLQAVTDSADAELRPLRRNLPLLAALANVATMLGLFGTVLGMIQAFDLIAAVGVSDAKVVATGIFQALVTTAAGLAVGIPILLAHALLRRRVDDRVLQLEEVLEQLLGEREDDEAPESAVEQGAVSTLGVRVARS